MELDQVVLTEWLRMGMRARGMTQRQLAALSGVDHSTISRILSGDRSAAWATVLRLAVALGEPLPFPQDPRHDPSAPARVERALRADPAIDARDLERVVRLYLELRSKSQGAGDPSHEVGSNSGPARDSADEGTPAPSRNAEPGVPGQRLKTSGQLGG
jgi:transcriptional regulator with XRE-family HTH domain